MYTLTFANKQVLEVIDGVLSFRDSSLGEQRDAFSFMVGARDIEFSELLELLSNPKNTAEIILTNDRAFADGENCPAGEATQLYSGYIDVVEVNYKRRMTQEKTQNVPAAFELVFEVTLAEQTNTQKQAPLLDRLLGDLSDSDAAEFVEAFPLWSPMGRYDGAKYNGSYEKDCRIKHNELLYKCIKAHTVDSFDEKKSPADLTELWSCIYDPADFEMRQK